VWRRRERTRKGGGGRAAMVQRGSRTLRRRLPMEDGGVLAARTGCGPGRFCARGTTGMTASRGGVGLGRDGQVEALHARRGAWAHGRAARGPARRVPVRGRIRRGQGDGEPHGVRRSIAETPKSVRWERWGGRVAQGLLRAQRSAATSALRPFFIPFSLLRNCITPKSSN
jgi:hypothetical protein